jgi:hypothetical protein
MSAQKPSLFHPDQITRVGEALIQEDRPIWSRTALSKLLNLIFPKIPSKRWEVCFGDSSGLDRVLGLLAEDEGWVLGRIHRALAEVRVSGLFAHPLLAELSWMETADFSSGTLEGGGGFSTVVGKRLQIVLRMPPSEQALFWNSFAEAFSLPIAPRQELKTILAYIFFVIRWREIQKCHTIRESFAEFRKFVPSWPTPSGVDPVDYEEQQMKWFEKISQRSLGLRLRPRGRPSTKLGKSPIR